MNLRAPLIAAALPVVIAGGYVFLALSGGSSEEPLPFSTDPRLVCASDATRTAIVDDELNFLRRDQELADTATPTSLEQREAALRERGTEAAYRVVYRDTNGSGPDAGAANEVERQLRACVRRVDQEVIGHMVSDIYTETTSYECGGGGVRVCMSHADVIAAYQEVLPFSDIVIDPSRAANFDLVGTSIANFELTPTMTPMPTVSPYLDEGRTVAGVEVICFGDNDGHFRRERCYSSDGILLYSITEYGDMRIEREAIEFSRDVSEADFELPYPVVTPTSRPMTPVSPPRGDAMTPGT